jgi:hypothetical protein
VVVFDTYERKPPSKGMRMRVHLQRGGVSLRPGPRITEDIIVVDATTYSDMQELVWQHVGAE